MNIAIVGGGKVGASLAVQLLNEGHAITVIDRSDSVVEQLGNRLDVIGCVGNGASYDVLESAGVRTSDLLIAVTASDEVNMLCCLIAHKLGAGRTIARVRNPEYHSQLYALKDDLGLSMSINPELEAANEIARVLRFPSATNVELFAKGRAELASFEVEAGSILDGMQLSELRHKVGVKVLVCAAEREDSVMIPAGSFVVHAGDMLYLTGAPHEMTRAFRKFGLTKDRARNVLIVGGGRITYYLANKLAAEGVRVKIVEKDAERAADLAARLPKAVVLCGDGGSHELLSEEGLDKQDAFVALTGLDEGNILSALYARRCNVSKVVAKVNNENLLALFRNSGLQSAVSPKQITANQILRYARALDAGQSSEDIQSLYKILDGRVEIIEFRAGASGSMLNIPLRALNVRKNVLLACIVRNGRAIVPGGDDCICAGDSVLVATTGRRISKLSDILEDNRA
ncbi:MAG: Trk system potassium transporter TrkA [Clostridia bacterium]|nr:Trk system potassium transporter TrkA [Clostridia bacterium]